MRVSSMNVNSARDKHRGPGVDVVKDRKKLEVLLEIHLPSTVSKPAAVIITVPKLTSSSRNSILVT